MLMKSEAHFTGAPCALRFALRLYEPEAGKGKQKYPENPVHPV